MQKPEQLPPEYSADGEHPHRPAVSRGRPVSGTDKRLQILEGARLAFIRDGFDSVSMNDVCTATGVSKSTLYSYFRDKQELFSALIEEERSRHANWIWSILEQPGDTSSKLTHLGEQFVDISAQDWAIRAQRTVLGVAERMPELARNFYDSGFAKAESRLAAYFDAEVAAGRLRIPDTLLAARQFIALCLAAHTRPRLYQAMQAPPGPEDVRQVTASAVAMFMAAYGPA